MAAKAGTAYVEFAADLSTLNKQVTAAVTPLIAKFGKVGSAAAVGLGAVAAAAVGTGAALAAIGEEFDAASDKIRTGTGATGKELKKLEGSFRRVVASVPADFDSASTAITDLNRRLDLSGKPLEKLSRNMLELSRITGEDLEGNIGAVSRVFGDWGIKTQKQVPTLNKLFRASQQTGIEITNLSELMVQFGSPLRQLGFSFDEAAAMFSKFEAEGVNLQTAMPGLRMALKNFAAAGKDPAESLKRVIEQLERAPSAVERNTLAFEVFGARAGADIAAAADEGRFAFDGLIRKIREGDDTVAKAGRATRDMSEEWKLFTNRLKVLVEPIATAVFSTLGKAMKAVNRIDFKAIIRSIKDFWREAGVLRDVVKAVVTFVKEHFGGLFDAIKGTVKLIVSVLRGDFKSAWEAVKDIFKAGIKTALAPFKAAIGLVKDIVGRIGDALRGTFGDVWEKVKDIWRGGVNALIGFVNAIIGAINAIPLVPDIGKIDKIGDQSPSDTSHAPQAHFSGGKITAPMAIVGEEAPQHHEYVLATNPRYRQRNLKLWEQAGHDLGIPGFQFGGILPSVGGSVAHNARDYLDKLPDASRLPGFFEDTGGYLLDKATRYIRDKVSSLAESAVDVVKGAVGNIKGKTTLQIASGVGNMFDLHITSGYRSPAHNAAVGGVPGSLHTHGTPSNPGAVDLVGAVPRMYAASNWSRSNLDLAENFVHDAGSGLHFHMGFFRKGGIIGQAVEFLRSGGKRGKGGGENRKGSVIKRPLPAALQKFNKVYPEAPAPSHLSAPKMPFDRIAMLAEFFGMPGVTMAQMTKGESAQAPGATGIDRGGTKGWGLWMITTSYNDAIANRLGGYPQLLNPIKNAIAAREVYRSQGLGAWYGDQFVTGSNLHWNGDFGNLVRADGTGGGGGGKGSDKPDKPDGPTLEVSGTTALGLTDYISKRLAKRIETWRDEIKRLVPLIGEYEEIHGAPYSEAGEELSGAERNLELGFNKTLLGNQESLRDGLKKAISKVRGKGIPEIVEKLRKELSGLVGITGDAGAILATKSKIWQLEHPEEADVSDNLAEILSLEQQRSLELLRENEILRRQTPVFSRLFTAAPFGGVFHSGGVVPGPLGADRTIIAQGGETITPAGTSPVEVTVVVQDGAVNPSAIDVRINDRLAQIARTSSPRGGVTGRKAVYG